MCFRTGFFEALCNSKSCSFTKKSAVQKASEEPKNDR